MSHVLLLSPDDQVVNAITAVLEELSLTCDRPLDGGSAAQKLNSHSFDLVLVDCENLPAAKLIFDVCRRGKDGHCPVPIAIVDGRAGLPTAFRLGAELILTKPVSKDQARTTIRAAVGRVKKDVPAGETVPASSLPHAAAGSPNSSNAENWSNGASEAASPQLTSFADPAPSFPPLKAAAAAAVTAPAPVDTPHRSPAIFAADDKQFSVAAESSSPKPAIPFTPSDDPVLAELERTEREATEKSTAATTSPAEPVKPAADHVSEHRDTPVFSSYQSQKKSSSAFVALMALVIAAGGLYGAWMYEPGFRTFVQPQIDRVVALAGVALPQTHALQAQKPVAQPAPTPAAAPVVAETPSAADPTKTSAPTADATTPAASSASGVPAPSATASVAPQPAAPEPAAPEPAAITPPAQQTIPATAPVVNKPAVTKIELGKTKVSKPENKKSQAAAPPSDAPLPGENNTIILSSKGAEKRLAHSVPAKYPAEARGEGAQGTVVLKEIVDENGKVTGVRLVEGNATLASAAMQAVKQWRYRPYVRDGKAQPFQTVVIVDFQKP